MIVKTRVLISIPLIALLLVNPVPATAQKQSWLTGKAELSSIDVAEVCSCSSETSKGSVKTKEEFLKTYNWIKFETAEEAHTAWTLFRTVNRCEAKIVIGRLDDTRSIAGRAGTCVLNDYEDWTPGINDAFIVAGTDRGAVFEAVSPPIGEIQIAPDGDMREHRRNIYNRELHLLKREGDYRMSGDIAAATPDNPVLFEAGSLWTGINAYDRHRCGKITGRAYREDVVVTLVITPGSITRTDKYGRSARFPSIGSGVYRHDWSFSRKFRNKPWNIFYKDIYKITNKNEILVTSERNTTDVARVSEVNVGCVFEYEYVLHRRETK